VFPLRRVYALRRPTTPHHTARLRRSSAVFRVFTVPGTYTARSHTTRLRRLSSTVRPCCAVGVHSVAGRAISLGPVLFRRSISAVLNLHFYSCATRDALLLYALYELAALHRCPPPNVTAATSVPFSVVPLAVPRCPDHVSRCAAHLTSLRCSSASRPATLNSCRMALLCQSFGLAAKTLRAGARRPQGSAPPRPTTPRCIRCLVGRTPFPLCRDCTGPYYLTMGSARYCMSLLRRV
jgi:hypothetical protein